MRKPIKDYGPWVPSVDGRHIQSDDFEYDVTLKVSGDFADDNTRVQYTQALAAQLNLTLTSAFRITTEQKDKANKWAKEHRCKTKDVGAIGGRIGYVFIPTGIGEIVMARCACGKEINLTDFSDW